MSETAIVFRADTSKLLADYRHYRKRADEIIERRNHMSLGANDPKQAQRLEELMAEQKLKITVAAESYGAGAIPESMVAYACANCTAAQAEAIFAEFAEKKFYKSPDGMRAWGDEPKGD